jgi:hypothetical protein
VAMNNKADAQRRRRGVEKRTTCIVTSNGKNANGLMGQSSR